MGHTFRLTPWARGVLGMIVLFAPAAASAAADSTTRLPLHPGLTPQQTLSSRVCGKPAVMSIYDTPSGSAKISEYLDWYKAQLPGALHVHAMWSNRAQEMFYTADGTKGVSITGRTHGDGVFAVTYMKLSQKLAPQQLQRFSPSNLRCK